MLSDLAGGLVGGLVALAVHALAEYAWKYASHSPSFWSVFFRIPLLPRLLKFNPQNRSVRDAVINGARRSRRAS